MSELPPHDLNELFQRDPLELTKTDIEAIITAFRAKRHQFNNGDLKAGKVKPPSKAKAGSLDSALTESLGIDI